MTDASDLQSCTRFIHAFRASNAGRNPDVVKVSRWGRARIIRDMLRLCRTPADRFRFQYAMRYGNERVLGLPLEVIR